MKFTDALGLGLSVVGTYNLVLYLRFLLPHNVILLALARLDETEAILDRAEAKHELPIANEFRTGLTILRNQLSHLRMESHRSPWFCQQVGLAVRSRLTWRVYLLHSEIGVFKRELEMAIDEYRRASLAAVSSTQIATTTALAIPATIVAIPMVNINIAEAPSPRPTSVLRRELLEMATDEHQPASLAAVSSPQTATTTALATPASLVAIPMVNIAEMPSPPPAAVGKPS